MLVNANSLAIPLPAESVHMICSSPPYWGLRDYGLATWKGGDVECDHLAPSESFGGMAGKQLTNAGSHQRQYDSTCAKCGAIRHDSGLGLEPLHDCLAWATGGNCGACYVCRMRLFAAECWRVLRDDGTLWLNLGDSYGSGPGRNDTSPEDLARRAAAYSTGQGTGTYKQPQATTKRPPSLKPKDLVGIPWRVALALQADGWYLRSDIIWAKPNPMPESVTDRPTKAHEYIFLLAKSGRYFYDADAVKTKSVDPESHNGRRKRNPDRYTQLGIKSEYRDGFSKLDGQVYPTRNRRTVWTVATQPYSGAHFATWPEALVEPMIKAGTSERGCCPECGKQWERVVESGEAQPRPDNPNPVLPYTAGSGDTNGTGATTLHMIRRRETVTWQPTCSHDAAPVPSVVLDPFAGSGTTGVVARRLRRQFVGLDLSFAYLSEQARQRLQLDAVAAFTNGDGFPAGETDTAGLPLFNLKGGGNDNPSQTAAAPAEPNRLPRWARKVDAPAGAEAGVNLKQRRDSGQT